MYEGSQVVKTSLNLFNAKIEVVPIDTKLVGVIYGRPLMTIFHDYITKLDFPTIVNGKFKSIFRNLTN